eukprot:CAMPEP_0183292658 /NCGR_PEP_ID=MMETSP0160_2-20130417/1624_1 /TAXON_ID=2839 ORGANISM="Odontella Sinensis, Strain Grunow 1884" /NCGR_SAMPLE_ID=MMETSP0160_2 /ASSEMBLY_ACC=CAM_ASM_000250 /LENGTH=155 /DNA_ID=CAMNT_0025453645 /DNA_START=76 /DNA_END=543 /DNA_ORIENTATION=-
MMYKICCALFLALAVAGPVAFGSSNLRTRELQGCYTCSGNDPCEEESSDYFGHCDKHKFIQCSNGYCNEFDCAGNTVWDEDAEKCDYDDELPPCEGEHECENPCTQDNINDGVYFHEHCDKRRWYLQCASVGVCYEMRCDAGTMWDDEVKACDHV